MKTCTKCGEEKELEEFHKNKLGKHGRQPHCKVCWKAYYQANKAKIKAYYKANKEKCRAYRKAYREANREKITKYRAKYKKRRYHSDPAYRLAENLRTRMKHALDGTAKAASTFELLGCTADQFKKHLESRFTDGMSWGQRGKWCIDHIIPVSAFDLTDPEHQRYAFHWSNTTPLWAKDNLEKSDKYDPKELEAYLNSDLPEYPRK